MKNLIILLVVLLLAGIGIFVTMNVRKDAGVTAAATAEGKGDFGNAAAKYAEAYLTIMPSLAVPDVNHSKFMAPPTWKKEMETYAAWLTGSSTPKVDRAKRNDFFDGIIRNAARLHPDNFTSKDSTVSLTQAQYMALWNNAFFARNVPVDQAHAPLATSCYAKRISMVRLSALTSYEYDVSLVDTANNRRTSFKVPPETRTFILAPPGKHLLICTSTITYPGGKFWRSTPTIIPITLPDTTSLYSAQLETHVVRDQNAPSPVQ
jgi:hypothetical protein